MNEYKVVVFAGTASEEQSQLNQLAADGWELVTTRSSYASTRFYLKRPKQ